MFGENSCENTSTTTKLDDSRQRNYSIARRRLDDNLQWRCSVCRSVVPTHETHLHLNSCLDINSAKEPYSSHSTLNDHQFLKELFCFAKPMEKKERPRTKRIERPTPNVKHPIIINKKSKEFDSDIKKCIEGINKCKTNTTVNVKNRSFEARHNSMSSSRLLHQKCDSNDGISCDQLNCNQFFSSNKMSINKRNKFQTLPKCLTKEEPKGAHLTTVPIMSDNKTLLSLHKTKFNSEPKITKKNLFSTEMTHEKQEKKKNDQKMEENEKKMESVVKDKCDSNGWDHFNAQLIPCSHCCRTFFPHRLPVHEKSCRGIGVGVNPSTTAKPESKVTVRTNIPMKSLFLECMTCGRKYSTTSLTLHELKCRTNNTSKRLSTGKGEMGNELSTAWEHFKSQLESCRKCKRKFLSDRLEKHEPNCKASPVYSTKYNDK